MGKATSGGVSDGWTYSRTDLRTLRTRQTDERRANWLTACSRRMRHILRPHGKLFTTRRRPGDVLGLASRLNTDEENNGIAVRFLAQRQTEVTFAPARTTQRTPTIFCRRCRCLASVPPTHTNQLARQKFYKNSSKKEVKNYNQLLVKFSRNQTKREKHKIKFSLQIFSRACSECGETR